VEAGWRSSQVLIAGVLWVGGAVRWERQESERDRRTCSRTQADTEYLARELAAIRLALGEMPTRDYLDDELARLRSSWSGRGPRSNRGAPRTLPMRTTRRSRIRRRCPGERPRLPMLQYC
jgi:hypothetical protein